MVKKTEGKIMRREEKDYATRELNLLADCIYKCWQTEDLTEGEFIHLEKYLTWLDINLYGNKR